MGLVQCCCLKDSDKYLEEILTASIDIALLGNIELNPEELNHLAKLIAGELGKPDVALHGSLSVAIFLVGMGIFHYHDNYWSPVYSALGLPPSQVKWQRVLGEAFLAAVEKYELATFADELRYIMPILAHGCVPNVYLDSYFRDVVLAIYKDRERAGLPVIGAEIEHLVDNWRQDYLAHHEMEKELAELKTRENSLATALDLQKNKDKLKRLQYLRTRVKESAELKALLTVPEGWLEQAEAKRDYLQQQISAYFSLLKQLKEIAAAKGARHSEIDALNRAIEVAGEELMERWDNSLAEVVWGLPINDIDKLSQEYADGNRVFTGSGYFWGRILRLLLRRRHRLVKECRGMLEQKLGGLVVRSDLMANPWPQLPEGLRRLQQLLRDRHDEEILLEKLCKAEQEIAAACPVLKGVSKPEIALWQDQLADLDKKIAGFKMQLVRLGKGVLEDGLKELSEQRSIRREIAAITAELSCGDMDSLLAALPWVEKYPEEKSLRENLIGVRKQKNDISEKLKTNRDPLYSLNESTRIFILQGGKLAEKFVFNSLLLMQRLDKGDEHIGTITLPSRIIQAMEKWWHQQGKDMLDKMRQPGGGGREPDSVTLRRPVIRLDPVARSVKVELPQQTLTAPAGVKFVVRGRNGAICELDIPMKKGGDGQYRTGAVIVNLESPEPVYNLEFRDGEISHSWKLNGIGGDNTCLLFTAEGELIEKGWLPESGAYLVVPAGSRVTPTRAIKEQERLTGSWSGYEYWYLELDDIDAVLIEIEADVSVFKRPVHLKPGLLGGEEIANVKAQEGTLYRGELPGLVFSVSDPEEVRLYGVRLDYPGGSQYMSLDGPGTVIRRDNIIFVPLSTLFVNVYGVCRITLICRQSIIWHEKCVVVPDLKLEFDQVIYRPQKGEKEIGKLELSSQNYITFVVQPPALLVESSPCRALIKFDARQNQIGGRLAYSINQGQDFQVEVYIDIPAVRWRKTATDTWKAEIEEIWHEDLGEIQVRLPVCVSGPVKLALDNDRQVISRQVREGMAVFNLRQFSDTLRSDNLPVHDLILSFHDGNIPACLLVKVRTRWQVTGISIEQRRDSGRRIIVLAWQDLGSVSNRLVRLWPLGLPGVEMLEQRVPDGVSAAEILEPYWRLPAGGYRLQFIVDDPWEEDKVILPGPDSENCIDVMIGDKNEILQDVLQNGLFIESFACDGEIIPVGRQYWIQDIAIKPEFVGEERFQGNVYTIYQDGNTVNLDCNPVSFYLDLDVDELIRLPFLVDRDKDGATYCKSCRELFWEIAHQECGRHGEVILPEYIFVQIRRGKDGSGSIAGN